MPGADLVKYSRRIRPRHAPRAPAFLARRSYSRAGVFLVLARPLQRYPDMRSIRVRTCEVPCHSTCPRTKRGLFTKHPRTRGHGTQRNLPWIVSMPPDRSDRAVPDSGTPKSRRAKPALLARSHVLSRIDTWEPIRTVRKSISAARIQVDPEALIVLDFPFGFGHQIHGERSSWHRSL